MAAKVCQMAATQLSSASVKLVAQLRAGLPTTSFDSLRARLEVSAEVLAETVGVAPRTLARRKKEGRFPKDESERLHRVSRLFERAVEVFEGVEPARAWFRSPQRGLGGSTPLAFADTEPGAREVENLLGRIEHGVFS